MTALQYILSIVIIIISVIIIVLVLFQESKQEGLSGAIAGAADSFFGKRSFLRLISAAVFIGGSCHVSLIFSCRVAFLP